MAFVATVVMLTMVQPTLASEAHSSGQVNYLTPSAESGCPSSACTEALSNLRSSVNLRVLPSSITPAVLAASRILQLPQGGQCAKGSGFGTYRPCRYPNSATGSTIAMIGNSHAWQWSMAVDQIAQRDHVHFALAFHSACFVTATAGQLFVDGKPGVAPPPAECQRWVNASAAWIVSLKPSTVIVVGDAGNLQGPEEEVYQRGFVQLLRTLHAKGRRLIVLGPQLPEHHGDASCLSVHAAAITGCGVPTSVAVPPSLLRQISDFHASAASVGARYVNPLPWLCTAMFCPAVIGGTVVQQDPYHLTTALAQQLAPVLQVAAGL